MHPSLGPVTGDSDAARAQADQVGLPQPDLDLLHKRLARLTGVPEDSGSPLHAALPALPDTFPAEEQNGDGEGLR